MQRIDTFLVAHQFVESREQAKRLILAGAVTVNGDASIKPGQRVPADAKVVVQAQQKYVSRGGFKLEKALSTFGVDVRDRVALDVGASTGGFTDCLPPTRCPVRLRCRCRLWAARLETPYPSTGPTD